MGSAWYNKGREQFANGNEDWLGSTIKVMLVKDTYTFDPDHNFVDTITSPPFPTPSHECSGAGYTAGFGNSGRKTLAGKSVTKNDSANRAELDATDVAWAGISAGVAAAAVLIIEKTSDADSILVAYLDIDPDFTTNGSTLTLQWNSGGLLQFS